MKHFEEAVAQPDFSYAACARYGGCDKATLGTGVRKCPNRTKILI